MKEVIGSTSGFTSKLPEKKAEDILRQVLKKLEGPKFVEMIFGKLK